MKLFSAMRRDARLALKGNWGAAIMVVLIPAAVSLFLVVLQQLCLTYFVYRPLTSNPTMQGIPDDPLSLLLAFVRVLPGEAAVLAAFILLSLLLTVPLGLGVYRWYFQLVHGRALPVKAVFYYFDTWRRYWKSIWLYINVSVRAHLWALLFFAVPGTVLGVAIFFLQQNAQRSAAVLATVQIFLCLILFLLTTLLYLAFMYRYILAFFLFCEDDISPVGGAVKRSIRYSKGYRFGFLGLLLTFVGWLVVVVCTFGVALLYTAPYFSCTFLLYSRYVVEKNRRSVPNETKEFRVSQETRQL